MKFECSDNVNILITKLSKVGLISEMFLFDSNLQKSEHYPSKEKMLRGWSDFEPFLDWSQSENF